MPRSMLYGTIALRPSQPRRLPDSVRPCAPGRTSPAHWTTQATTRSSMDTLEAIDCGNGARLAREQFTADNERLIDELGRAAQQMRLDLGEPPESVRRASTALSSATS